MTEPLPQPPPPQTSYPPVDADVDPDLARRNAILGLVLFAFALLVFGGTIGVALLYLALD
jgi:hypothetical protein